jgi:hypothetical protein
VRVQGWQTPVRNESDSGWTPAMAAQSAEQFYLVVFRPFSLQRL